MADRRFIAPAALFPLLHRPDAPRVLDLRDEEDAAADPRAIPGGVPATLDALEVSGPVVCSCQKGGKLSQLAAADLRARGLEARSLEGGHLAWAEAALPLVAAVRPARWVMPVDPDWDGVAALWVLRRLIDRDAPVRAVERAWLPKAAEAWDAAELPSDPHGVAEAVGLGHPVIARLPGGPEPLLAGRLTRVDPEDALDLVDDWLARPEAAA